MYRHWLQWTVALAIVGGAFLPRSASAQAALPTTIQAATVRAALIEAQAERIVGDRSQWGRVARLMEQAAELRPAGDPLGVSDLMMAGGARYYSGKKAHARELFTRAAERALADGDVDVAARSLLRAAIVAGEQHDTAAEGLKARAERLAGSPLLTDVQRRLILAQFRAPIRLATHEK